MKVAERTIWLAIVVVGALLVLAIIFPPEGRAHLIVQSKPKQTKEQIHANQTKNLAHVRYVCRRGKAETKRWHCRTARWLYREWKQTLPAPTYGVGYWAQRQINAANHLAANSALDPWPNCPDPGPRDNQGPGHSWFDTVACENGGNWYDSPGYYRCGLQFDPMWEKVYGRLCP